MAKRMTKQPKESDLRFIKNYAANHNKDFGSNIPLTEKMARKAYKQICENCHYVEEEFYYSMKQYFA